MSLHDACVPVFNQMLDALSATLIKAEAHAEARKIAPDVMLGLRLVPDMFSLTKQVQVACDFAKNTSGRLAEAELPKFADAEKSFDELQERIAKTKAFISELPAKAFAGGEARIVTFLIAGKPHMMKGEDYLAQFAMPNFYFHLTAAYAILRANGVALGKLDYMGRPAGLMAG